MLLHNAYVIGTSWNILLVIAAMLIVLADVYEEVMNVASRPAKMDSLIVICATIGNVLNVLTTLKEIVWLPGVVLQALPPELELAHVMLVLSEQTIKIFVYLVILTVQLVHLEILETTQTVLHA